MKKDVILDGKFVLAALIIGAAYSVIVVLLAYFAGKEMAGVAGVALTALATAIFKQFERLRFEAVAVTEGLTLVAENPYVLTMLTALIYGVNAIILSVSATLILLFAPLNEVILYIVKYPEQSIKAFTTISTIYISISFFVSSHYSVRAMKVVRYSSVIISTLIVLISSFLIQLVTCQAIAKEMNIEIPVASYIGACSLWPIYIGSALAGARTAVPMLLRKKILGSNLELMPLEEKQ